MSTAVGVPFSDPDTSLRAAVAVKPRVEQYRQRVLEAVQRAAVAGRHGLTREELEVRLGMDGNTLQPRVWELVNAGLLVDTGVRRRNRSGRHAAVMGPANNPPAAQAPRTHARIAAAVLRERRAVLDALEGPARHARRAQDAGVRSMNRPAMGPAGVVLLQSVEELLRRLRDKVPA